MQKIKKMLAAVCLTFMSFITIVGCSCVKDSEDDVYSISLSVSNSEHGTIESNKTEAKKGEAIVITPKAKRGYDLDYIKVDDVTCALNKEKQCEFSMPKKDISVSASFKKVDVVEIEYQYDSEAVSVETTSAEYYPGDEVVFDLETKLSYVVDSVKIGNTELTDSGEGYSFTVPSGTSKVTVVISTSKKVVNTLFKAGTGYVNITNSVVSARVGDTLNLTDYFKLSSGYCLDYFMIKGKKTEETTYTVTDEEVEISIFAIRGNMVTYEGVERASAKNVLEYYKAGVVLNLDKLFNFDEGYVANYYKVNGEKIEGTTYVVENEDVTISLEVVQGYKVTYIGIDNAPAVVESVYYKEGTTLSLTSFFDIDEKYAVSSFVVNGEEIEGTTYTITAENVPVSLVLEEAVKINLTSSTQHVETKSGYVYVKKGTEVNLRDYFKTKDGYIIDHYLVNGVVIDKPTYIVVTEVTVDVAVDLIGITYSLVDNVSIKKNSNPPGTVKVGHVLKFNDIFEIQSGYVVDYYTVNGKRIEGSTYIVGEEDIDVSLEVSEGVLIRFSGVPYAGAVYEELYFKEGEIIDLSKYFGIVPGYGVTNYIRNGTSIGASNKYKVTRSGGTISLIVAKTQEITFVGNNHATVKEEVINLASSAVLNLDDYFELDEGYYVDYYIVNGSKHEGHTLTNFTNAIVSLVVAEGGTKITYTSNEHGSAKIESSNYKVGKVINLDNIFEVELGYSLEYYMVNGEKIEGKEYTVTNEEATISLMTIKVRGVYYKSVENGAATVSSRDTKIGTVLKLNECFLISEGYVLDYYTVNGEKIEGNEYTIIDEDVTISLVVLKGVKVSFTGGSNARGKQAYAYYKEGTVLNLDDCFNVDDTYVVTAFFVSVDSGSHYVLSTREYTVGNKPVEITTATTKGNKITFVNVDHATAKLTHRYASDKITLNLDNCFVLDEGYVVDYYTVNGQKIDTNIISGANAATVSVVVKSGVKVTYVGIEHVTVKSNYKYYKEGTQLTLTDRFEIDEKFVVDYYTVNGERIEGTTYTVTAADVTISVVVSEWRDITYTAGENTGASVSTITSKVGTELNLDEIFTITTEGYLFEYYTVNNERIQGTTYIVESGTDVTISMVVVKGIKVTYVGDTHASVKQSYGYYKLGDQIILEEHFDIEEGYALSRYLLNGSHLGTSKYSVGFNDAIISLEVYKLVKATFVGVNHGSANKELEYIIPGNSIDLTDYFSIDEDYGVVCFKVNGTRVEGTTYRVGTNDVTISLEVSELSNVTYTVPENVTLNATNGPVRVGTTINLNECFDIEEGYVVDYYIVNGEKLNDSTYLVGTSDVTISLVVKLITVTYTGVEHAGSIRESELLKKGTQLDLNECFDIEEGYLLDHYTINGERLSGSTYTVGSDDVTISLVVKLITVTYTEVEHATAKNTTTSVKVGTEINLAECFDIEEGYLLDYYTVNGERVNGTVYIVGTSDVTISIGVKLITVTYIGVEHAAAKNTTTSVKVGTAINLSECFEIEAGYELDYYVVNGTKVEGTTYTVGTDNLTISLIVAELSKVTYIVPTNVTLNASTGLVRVGTEINLAECFDIEEGYELDYYTVNGNKVNITKYTVGSDDVIISLMVAELSAVNYTAPEHTVLNASNAILRVGTEIDLSKCYEIIDGYVFDHYTVNGTPITGSKYTVGSEDVTISIVVKLITVTYTKVENTTVENAYELVSVGTEINLEEIFEIGVGYTLSYYTVDGSKITGNTYIVGSKDINVSLVIEKMGKLHFVSYSDEVIIKQELEYVKKGTPVDLNNYFEITKEGYTIGAYLLDGEEISGSKYIATDEEVTLAVVLIKLNKLEFTNGENATRKYEYKYFEKDDSIDLNSYYDIDDTHVLDYYTVNGEKINGTTYTVGTSDVVISIVTKLVKINYVAVDHVTVVNEKASVTVGTEIDLSEQFVISEGYLLEYYTVNGNRVDGSKYTVGKKDLIISIIVVQGIRITYVGDTNAPANQSYAYYKQGTEIDLEKQFTIKEGYALSNYLYDGYYMETSKVIINRSAQFSIKVDKLTKVTFVGVDHAPAKQSYAYYDEGTELKLDELFGIENGYEVETYKVNNNPIAGTRYVVTSNDVTVSLKVLEGTKVNYTSIEHVSVANGFAIKVPGTEINLEEIFNIEEGYFLEYYTLNGDKHDGSTYTVGEEEVTLSLVIVKGTKVIFEAVEHANVNKAYAYYRVGTNIDLGAQFELDEGYKVSRYLLNGLTLGATSYTVGAYDASISLEVYRLTKVTFVGVDHGLTNKSYEYYSPGTKLELDELFDIEEGYEVLTYKVDNNPISGNTYTVISSDVRISLEVLEGTRVNYASIDNVVVSKSFTINMPGTVINLAEQFTIAEGYFLEYYTLNGDKHDGSTYTVGEEEVTLSLVIVKGTKVSYTAVSNTTAKASYVYYRVGTQIDLAEQFEIAEGYKLTRYLLNGSTLGVTDYYTVGSQDASISLEVVRLTKVTFVKGNHVNVNKEYVYYNVGDVIDLDAQFTIETGYMLNTYRVNGVSVSGTTYTVGANDATIVAKVVKSSDITFVALEHAEANKNKLTVQEGRVLNLNAYFKLEEGYVLDHYKVNNKPIIGTSYTVGSDDVTITIVAKLVTVTYKNVEHATAVNASVLVKANTIIDLDDQFTIAEGYKLSYYTANGIKMSGSIYTVRNKNVEFSIVLEKLTKLNFVDSDNVNVKLSHKYIDIGETVDLSLSYEIAEGYVLDYYTVNNERIEGKTYTSTTVDEVNISVVVVKGVKINFVSISQKVIVKENYIYVKEGTILDVLAYFEIASGYKLNYYLVNGSKGYGTTYTVGSEDVTISIVIIKK